MSDLYRLKYIDQMWYILDFIGIFRFKETKPVTLYVVLVRKYFFFCKCYIKFSYLISTVENLDFRVIYRINYIKNNLLFTLSKKSQSK